MKFSIRAKLALSVVFLMLFVTVVGILAINIAYEDYLIQTRISKLGQCYFQAKKLLSSDNIMVKFDTNTVINEEGILEQRRVASFDFDKKLSSGINNYCQDNFITFIYEYGNIIRMYGSEDQMLSAINEYKENNDIDGTDTDDDSVTNNFQALSDIDVKQLSSETIFTNDNYSVDKVVIETNDGENVTDDTYLQLAGRTEDGGIYIFRTSLATVAQTVSSTTWFFLRIMLSMIFVALIGMLFIAEKFTKPILELSAISKKMSKLDFDATYSGKNNDEIGVLGNSMNELSQKLKTTISELKSANVELQKDIDRKTEIESMRNDFISNVSHELKTPIALIQGYAEGLKDGITDDPESMDFYCDVIIDEANKMNRMVKNLLTLNQIEHGQNKVEMERFDVAQVVKSVVESQYIRAEQNKVTMDYVNDGPAYVWADEYQVEEVVTNYVSNAFNHVKEVNGRKLIKVQIDRKDDIVRISVFNTGNNIPESDLEHIWEKFYKVDKARTREYGGNGIGLSIVRAIMDRFGQKCGVINREDGVEFWAELDGKA